MDDAHPLFSDIYQVDVPETWTDHYGHMNEGHFVVAASDASWAFQAHLDIGTAYYDRTGCALVTVETHVRYLAEVSCGECLSFDSLVIGHDARRLHIGHVFRVGERPCGTIECMWLHLDHQAGRTTAFAPGIEKRLAALVWEEPPQWAGCRIGLDRGGRPGAAKR